MVLGSAVLALAACAKSSAPNATCPRPEDCPPAATGELRAQPMREASQPVQRASACAVESGPLSADVRAKVERALVDERRAEAEYDALATAHGYGMPLSNIVRSERRHAVELEELLRVHGAPVPTRAEPAPPSAAASAREACAIGAASERKNIALYDELLASPLPADVRCVFERLRAMSLSRHLPAFERCSGR